MAKQNEKMKFSVMTIKPHEETPELIKYNELIYAILDRTNSINERKLPLNIQDPEGDCEFVMDFKLSNGLLIGSFSRLTIGSESAFSETLFDQKTISINEVVRTAQDGTAGSIRDASFFCITDELMVMTSAHFHRKALELYINWLIRENFGEQKQCMITPKLKSHAELPLKNISSIRLGDAYLQNSMERIESHKLKSEALRRFFSDVQTLERIQDENIIDAVLTLKIKKKEVKRAREMETLLRVIDDEDITILGPGGKRLKGSEFKIASERKIERSDGGFYNTQEIESCMRDIIRKVKNHEDLD